MLMLVLKKTDAYVAYVDVICIDTQSFSNSFEGCEKIWGGPLFPCIIAFLWSNFLKSYEGVHVVPPFPPLPVCIYGHMPVKLVSTFIQVHQILTKLIKPHQSSSNFIR